MTHLPIRWMVGLSTIVSAISAYANDFDASKATVDSVIETLHDAMATPRAETLSLVVDQDVKGSSALSFSPDGDQIALANPRIRSKTNPQTASVVVFDVNSGEPVRRFELPVQDYPGAIAIAPDGRHLAVAAGDKVIVYDESNEVVHTHEGFKSSVNHLEITADGSHLIAADTSCVVVKRPLLGEQGWQKQVADWKKGFQTFDASDDGNSVVVAHRDGRFLEILFPKDGDDTARASDYGGMLDGAKAVARGVNGVLVVRGFDVIASRVSADGGTEFSQRQVKVPGLQAARLSNDDQILTMLSSDGVLVVLSAESLSVGSVSKFEITKAQMSRPKCRISNDGKAYAIVSSGRLKVWKSTGDALKQTRTFHTVFQALFEERRFDLLTKVSRRILTQDDVRIPVIELRQFLLPSQLTFDAEQRMLDLKAWYQADPNSIYPRLILSQIAKERGFAARGTKVISETSEEQIAGLQKHIAESAKYLDGYEPDKNTPHDYYSLRISQQLGGHKPEEFAETVNALMKFQPRLIEAHSQAMLFLMPRWYGEQGDCERYANRLAAVLGQHDGEEMYSLLAEILLPYYPQEEYFERTSFKYDRIQKYLDEEDKLAKTESEKDRVISQRVRFAYRASDFDTALAAYRAGRDSGWKNRNRLNKRPYMDMLRVEQWLIRNKKMKGLIINADGTLDLKNLPPLPKSKK